MYWEKPKGYVNVLNNIDSSRKQVFPEYAATKLCVPPKSKRTQKDFQIREQYTGSPGKLPPVRSGPRPIAAIDSPQRSSSKTRASEQTRCTESGCHQSWASLSSRAL